MYANWSLLYWWRYGTVSGSRRYQYCCPPQVNPPPTSMRFAVSKIARQANITPIPFQNFKLHSQLLTSSKQCLTYFLYFSVSYFFLVSLFPSFFHSNNLVSTLLSLVAHRLYCRSIFYFLIFSLIYLFRFYWLRFKTLTAVVMKTKFLWNVTTCNLVDTQDFFGETSFLHLQHRQIFLLRCLVTQYFIICRLSYRFFGSFPIIFKSPCSFSYARTICNIIFTSGLRSSGLLRSG